VLILSGADRVDEASQAVNASINGGPEAEIIVAEFERESCQIWP